MILPCGNTCGNISATTIIKPPSQLMTFGDIWIYFHDWTSPHAYTFATIELCDTGAFNKNNVLRSSVEVFCLITPECKLYLIKMEGT